MLRRYKILLIITLLGSMPMLGAAAGSDLTTAVTRPPVNSTQDLDSVPTFGDPIRVLRYGRDVQYAYPRWSKDGKSILYQSNETGKWQIYLMDAGGAESRRVTRDTFNDNFIDWSPDNSAIAFVSDRGGDEDVYIMNVDGGHLINLSHNPARDIHPYWSPDGNRLLFNSTRNDTSFQVYQVNRDGSGLRRLSYTTDNITCARLSPDGQRMIMLRAYQGINDEVFLSNSDGTNPQNLTNSEAAEGWPAWWPDGTRIVFSSKRSGGFRLFSMRPDGSQVSEFTHSQAPWDDGRAMVSPDGATLVFNRQRGESIAIVSMPLLDGPKKPDSSRK